LRFFFFLSINYHHVDFILTVGCVGIDPQWSYYIASCFLDLLWTCWAWSQGYDNTSEDRENCLCRQVGRRMPLRVLISQVERGDNGRHEWCRWKIYPKKMSRCHFALLFSRWWRKNLQAHIHAVFIS
jgi:hypothetical protein